LYHFPSRKVEILVTNLSNSFFKCIFKYYYYHLFLISR
jgi:hypothetical protein